MAAALTVEPIRDADLDAVCSFLRAKFESRCGHDVWRRAFVQPWAASKPNNGFVLMSGGEIVGVLGAIYSDQMVAGRLEKFCNMTSWYVVDEHRSRGLLLVLELIRQQGFTFTNLSASPEVEEILTRMGFTPLSRDIYSVPNVALPFHLPSRVRLVDDPDAVARVLPPQRAQICRDHKESRVSQLAIGSDEDGYCHVMFSRCGCRHIPCAIVHDVAAPHLLAKFWTQFAGYALYRTGALLTRIEAKLLDGAKLPLALPMKGRSGALFLSRTVGADAISRRYSEAMNLTGC
ncbi:MAG TPA: hypothetical protein VG986_07190 [Pseudolabrys sp.]|nr:hypothetical protein [Pseudolabrys sp.]